MRSSSLRQDRQKQYAYMSQQEYDQEIRQQIEEKRRRDAQEKLQQEQDTLAHYKNYKFGADAGRGENPALMNDLKALVSNKEREIAMQRDQIMGDERSRQNVGFSGDMNELSRVAQNRSLNNIPPMIDKPNYS